MHIGFNRTIDEKKIIAIMAVSGSRRLPRHIKRIINDYGAEKKLTDSTRGRKVKSIIFTEDGKIILAPLSTRTILDRINSSFKGMKLLPKKQEQVSRPSGTTALLVI